MQRLNSLSFQLDAYIVSWWELDGLQSIEDQAGSACSELHALEC